MTTTTYQRGPYWTYGAAFLVGFITLTASGLTVLGVAAVAGRFYIKESWNDIRPERPAIQSPGFGTVKEFGRK